MSGEPIEKPRRVPWPPHAAEGDAPPRESAYWRTPRALGDDDGRRAATMASIDLPAPREGTLGERVRAWWEAIETVWLGRTAASFLERAAAQGWAPDPPMLYCPSCAESVGPYELQRDSSGRERCGSCAGSRLPWQRALRLGDYRGLLRRAVHELKFTAWRRVGEELGTLLGAMIALELDRAGIARQEAALVPVPTFWARRLARGIDHTLTLCRSASKASGVEVAAVLRRRAGPTQVEVAASSRSANIRGRLTLVNPARADGKKHLLVVDDVRTTGATMREACRAIREGLGRSGYATFNGDLWACTVAVSSGRRGGVVWGEEGRSA